MCRKRRQIFNSSSAVMSLPRAVTIMFTSLPTDCDNHGVHGQKLMNESRENCAATLRRVHPRSMPSSALLPQVRLNLSNFSGCWCTREQYRQEKRLLSKH